MKAIDALVDRTEDTAVAACTIRASGHLAALGLFVLQAAERGRVAWLCQRTPPIMALAGASAPAIGNNPMAFAAPIAGGAPLVFDMAASVVARGHVLQASRDHAGIPEGWALGPDGQPTTDPTAALAGAMLPIAGHKGIGLAMLVECLGGALAGGIPAQSGKTDSKGSAADASGFALVLNPDRFVGREAFDAGMRRWLTHYLDSSGPGCRYPGQRQADSERHRAMEGIPLPASVVRELSSAGEAVGMAFDVGSQR